MKTNLTRTRCNVCNVEIALTDPANAPRPYLIPSENLNGWLDNDDQYAVDVCPRHKETMLRTALSLLSREHGDVLYERVFVNKQKEPQS